MQTWMKQLRKALVEFWLLGQIAQGQSYGYQLQQLLFEHGAQQVAAGAIYPILARFKREGLVTLHKAASPLGPPRYYYRLTRAGASRLERMTGYWREMSRATEKALNMRAPA